MSEMRYRWSCWRSLFFRGRGANADSKSIAKCRVRVFAKLAGTVLLGGLTDHSVAQNPDSFDLELDDVIGLQKSERLEATAALDRP